MTEDLAHCPFCGKNLVEWKSLSARSYQCYGHPELADGEEPCILSDIRIMVSGARVDHERIARWNLRTPAEPPTGIAREAYGAKIPFVIDCLRHYARILRDSQIDPAGHYFPSDIEEAADMLEQGDMALLEVAEKIVASLAYTPERMAAMDELRTIVGELKAAS